MPVGVVAQLGERLNGIQEVDSSILFGSTTSYFKPMISLTYLSFRRRCPTKCPTQLHLVEERTV
jgi:hypothetical protein